MKINRSNCFFNKSNLPPLMTEETLKTVRKFKEEAILLEEKKHNRLEVLNNIQNLVEEIDKSQQVVNNVINLKNSKNLVHTNLDLKNEANFSQNLNDHIINFSENMNEPNQLSSNWLLLDSANNDRINKENNKPLKFNPLKLPFSNTQNQYSLSETFPKKEIYLPLENSIISIESLNNISPYLAKQIINSIETEESIDSGFISNRKSDINSEQNLAHISIKLRNIQENLKSFSNATKCPYSHSRNAALSNILLNHNHIGLKIDNTNKNLSIKNEYNDLHGRESQIISNISPKSTLNSMNLNKSLKLNSMLNDDTIISNASFNSLITHLENGQYNSKDTKLLSFTIESENSSNKSDLMEQYKILLKNTTIENDIVDISKSLNQDIIDSNYNSNNDLNMNSEFNDKKELDLINYNNNDLNRNSEYRNKKDLDLITSDSSTYESCEPDKEISFSSKNDSDENLRTKKFISNNNIFEVKNFKQSKEKIITYLNLSENNCKNFEVKKSFFEYRKFEYLDLANFDKNLFPKYEFYFEDNIIFKRSKIENTNESIDLSIISNISSICENNDLPSENINLVAEENINLQSQGKFQHIGRFLEDLKYPNQSRINIKEKLNTENKLYDHPQLSHLLDNNFKMSKGIADNNNIDSLELKNINTKHLPVIQIGDKSNTQIKKPKKFQTFSKKYSESNSGNANISNLYNNKDKVNKYNLTNVPLNILSETKESNISICNSSDKIINFSERQDNYSNNLNSYTSSINAVDESEFSYLKRLEKKLELMRRHHRIQMEQILIKQEQEQLLLQQEILSVRQHLVKKTKELKLSSSINKENLKEKQEKLLSNKELSNENVSKASSLNAKDQATLHKINFISMNLDTLSKRENNSVKKENSNIKDHCLSINNESFCTNNSINDNFINTNNNSLSRNNLHQSFLNSTINDIYSEKSIHYNNELNKSFVTDISDVPYYIRDPIHNKINGFNSTFNYVDEKLLNAGHILFHKLGALVKGYLTRRILKSRRVQYIIKTIKDTAELAETIQQDISATPGKDEILLLERIDKQLTSALYDFYDIFFEISIQERMNIISQQKLLEKEIMFKHLSKDEKKNNRLSAATVKLIERKQKNMTDVENYSVKNKASKYSPLSKKTRSITKPKDRIPPKISARNKIVFKDDDDLSSCSSISIFNLKHLQQPNIYNNHLPLNFDNGKKYGNKILVDKVSDKNELIPPQKKNNSISKSRLIKSNIKTRITSKTSFK